MVQHVSLTTSSEIHVCKGADTATVGQLPFFDGAGGQVNAYSNPHGSCYFVNYAAPYMLAYPAAYTKLAPVTVAGGVSIEVTEGLNARITYIGDYATKARVFANLTVDQSVGASRDIGLMIHKNGNPVAGSEIFTTAPSGQKQLISSLFDLSLVKNDYLELYAKNFGASGDINVYAYVLSLLGVRG